MLDATRKAQVQLSVILRILSRTEATDPPFSPHFSALQCLQTMPTEKRSPSLTLVRLIETRTYHQIVYSRTLLLSFNSLANQLFCGGLIWLASLRDLANSVTLKLSAEIRFAHDALPASKLGKKASTNPGLFKVYFNTVLQLVDDQQTTSAIRNTCDGKFNLRIGLGSYEWLRP